MNTKIVFTGDVHQIDLYKNGKLQLLFNTQSKLHLIDRNGNNVEQFPIGLVAKATNGLFVLGNRQHLVAKAVLRLVVATDD